MPNRIEVLKKISNAIKNGRTLDDVRHNYLSKLHEKSKRNIISYYSGWLQKPPIDGLQINDDDKNGLMAVINGLDCSKGLDLILHTPGGDIAATESIIDYLHRKFEPQNIRVIVPQLAMSAGTMIACSGKTIIMGKQSSLGPIDPQLKGVPAYGVIHEFETAHQEIKEDSSALSVWQFVLNKYHPTFLSECRNAISLAKELVEDKLKNVMFKEYKNNGEKAEKVVEYLTDYKKRKAHSRHINIDECKGMGLKVVSLEKDQEFQDLVLTVHHCYMYSLDYSPILKIIENHNGAAYRKVIVPPIK
jgi:hypothetical protein